MRILIGFVLGLVVLVAGGLLFIYSGLYDIAASRPHNPVVAWVLETTRTRSIAARAEDVVVPVNFTEAQISRGLAHFREACVRCHGAPGVEPAEFARGLLPDPPRLSEALPHWTTAERFWIVKHGIKMSGMPAFGPTHSDDDLWSIVAFLERLPGLTPEAYADLAEAAGGHGHGEGAAGHGGGR